MFDETLNDDVVQFVRRLNTKTVPQTPKQTLKTEIIQLNPEQSHAFLSATDPQLGFQILKSASGNALGN